MKPDIVGKVLLQRKQEIEKILLDVNKRISNAPQGSLRIVKTGGNYTQYYHRKDSADKNGKYIRKTNQELISGLAQKEYDIRVCDELEKQIEEITTFLCKYNSRKIEEVFEEMKEERKSLVSPLYLPDDEYIERWKQKEYPKKGFQEDGLELITDAGERVRSKSEVIIANKLNRMGVPYRYEYPIQFASGRIVHPDFYCLNVRTRREIVYEHFGMMDNLEYASIAVMKMNEYQRNNYWLGKNFIATFETGKRSISTSEIEKLIETYLL